MEGQRASGLVGKCEKSERRRKAIRRLVGILANKVVMAAYEETYKTEPHRFLIDIVFIVTILIMITIFIVVFITVVVVVKVESNLFTSHSHPLRSEPRVYAWWGEVR